MDFFSGDSVTDLSVSDVFEREVQNEMDQILSSDSARFSPRPSGSGRELMTASVESTDFTDLGTISNYFQEQAVQTTAQDINPTSVMTSTANSVDLNQISAMDGVDNGINGLLVDPQTGLPVSTTALQLDPNSAQASLQMIVNSLPGLQAQIAASSAESLGLTSIGSLAQAPILSLSAAQHLQQPESSPVVLSTPGANQNLTIQNGTLQATDLTHISLTNFNELAAQTLISQLQQQQQQVHLANNGNVQNGSSVDLDLALKPHKKGGDGRPGSPKTKADKVYPKPAYSYSCLITMALKNSDTGCLPVSEIYQFMCENFPYFKTAPDGWKNSVRHNLSLNKCFAKIEKPAPANSSGSARKGCLWAMNPEKQTKMEEEVYKWTKKDPLGIKRSMAKPEEFSRIEALSRVTSSPKSSPKPSSPPLATVPPPLQSIISTATTTTVSSSSSETRAEAGQGMFSGEQFFGTSLNMQDPTLTQLDGDLGLHDNLLDTFSDMDIPMTTSPLTAFSFSGSLLDTSPVKDATAHTVASSSAFLSLEPTQTHAGTAASAAALQFCSPTRTPQVTAFM